jgi:hypothetical protein
MSNEVKTTLLLQEANRKNEEKELLIFHLRQHIQEQSKIIIDMQKELERKNVANN